MFELALLASFLNGKSNKIIYVLIFLGIIFLITKRKEKFSQSDFDNVFSNLRKEWSNIFPDNNRNSGGVQFFEYIYNKIKPSKKEFDIYNKLYCGVSGSTIDPRMILGESGVFKKSNNANNFVRVKHIDGSYRCGFYYRCCWPCCCDIMNENVVDVVVEDINLKLKDGTFKYSVLTIPDPCSKSRVIKGKEVLVDPDNSKEPWGSVSAFDCRNKITRNSVKTPSGRIIFAVLFNSEKCTLEKYKKHKFYDKELAEKCDKRNNSQDNFQKWGMGDIFVNLARK